MIYTNNLIKSIGVKVKLPMLLEINNNGAVEMTHNYSLDWRSKYMKIIMLWLRELQEKGVLEVRWIIEDLMRQIFRQRMCRYHCLTNTTRFIMAVIGMKGWRTRSNQGSKDECWEGLTTEIAVLSYISLD